jgi:hypothetical protein
MKIILIGNGPSILEKSIGHEIEQHDVVVRLNDFKTINYEKSVGERTDILITNGNPNREHKDLTNIKEVYICCRSFKRTFQGIRCYIPKYVLDEVDSLFNSFNEKNILACPTTGLYSCMFLYKKYNTIINTYGLNELKNPTHYYNNNYFMDLTNHSSELENKTYEFLYKNEYIKSLI